MTNSNFFIGAPIKAWNLCKIYPPKVREIIEEEEYPFFCKILLITQEDLEDMKADGKIEDFMTPFSFLLNQAQNSKTIEDLIKKGFYFFIHENITILYDLKIIVVGDLEEEINKIKDIKELRILSEKDYFVFQNLLRESIGEEKVEPFKVETNPRIREIKAKGRRRERAKRKSQQGISLGTLLSAICCMGIGITPLNIGEISYAALSSIKDLSQKKEKYEIDVRSLLAGADSKKVKPVYWITEEKLD